MKMYAVIQTKPDALVAVFLTEGDAKSFLRGVNFDGSFYVKEFDLDWDHWIEYRKTLGIY